jgi:hypothetical protein
MLVSAVTDSKMRLAGTYPETVVARLVDDGAAGNSRALVSPGTAQGGTLVDPDLIKRDEAEVFAITFTADGSWVNCGAVARACLWVGKRADKASRRSGDRECLGEKHYDVMKNQALIHRPGIARKPYRTVEEKTGGSYISRPGRRSATYSSHRSAAYDH